LTGAPSATTGPICSADASVADLTEQPGERALPAAPRP
jgi:hypothetical protein